MSKNKSIKNQVKGELMKKLAIGKSHHKAKMESVLSISAFKGVK